MNPTISSYLEQGRQLEAKGDVVGAIKLYSSLLRNAPDEASVHIQLASCYDRIGRTSEAVKYLQHVRGMPEMQPRQQYNPATGLTETDAQAQQQIDAALRDMATRMNAQAQQPQQQPQPRPMQPIAQQPPQQAAPPPGFAQPQAPAAQAMNAGYGAAPGYAPGQGFAPAQQQPGQPAGQPGQPAGQQAGYAQPNAPYTPYQQPAAQGYDPRAQQPQPPQQMPGAQPMPQGAQGDPRAAAYDPRLAQGYGYPQQPMQPPQQMPPPSPQQQAPPQAQQPTAAASGQQPGYAYGEQPPQGANYPPQGAQPAAPFSYDPRAAYPNGAAYENRMQTQIMAGELTDYDPMSTRGYDPLAGYEQRGQTPAAYDPRQPQYGQQPGTPAAMQPPADPYAQQAQQPAPQGYPPQPQPYGNQAAYPPQDAFQAEGTQPLPNDGYIEPGYDGYGGYAQQPEPPRGMNPALLVILCVLLPPVGLILLWRKDLNPFSSGMRIVLTVSGVLMTLMYAALIYFLVLGGGDPGRASQPTPSPSMVASTSSLPSATPTVDPGGVVSTPEPTGDLQTQRSGDTKYTLADAQVVTSKAWLKKSPEPREGYVFVNVQCLVVNEGEKTYKLKLDGLFTLQDTDAQKLYEPYPFDTMSGEIEMYPFAELVAEPFFEVPKGAKHFLFSVHAQKNEKPLEFTVEVGGDAGAGEDAQEGQKKP